MEWIREFSETIRTQPVLAVLLAWFGGVLASFTPCTYPMVPITVGFIGARAQGSRWKGFVLSLYYVLGLALVYSSLAAFAACTGRLFGALTSTPWVYLTVGNICLLCSLVMLDVVPLPAPHFLGRMRTSGLPGHEILASLLLGGTSALVVSPCTTPVLGVLLTFTATAGSPLWSVGMLFAFACGLGILVVLIGTFTGLLASLPKSGLWMVRVQKTFAAVMVLAAEYYLVKSGWLWI